MLGILTLICGLTLQLAGSSNIFSPGPVPSDSVHIKTLLHAEKENESVRLLKDASWEYWVSSSVVVTRPHSIASCLRRIVVFKDKNILTLAGFLFFLNLFLLGSYFDNEISILNYWKSMDIYKPLIFSISFRSLFFLKLQNSLSKDTGQLLNGLLKVTIRECSTEN